MTERIRGFTLLELMIVVAVIAILSAIAIPSYRDYVLRSRRSEAIVALTELANLQEKYYSANNRYAITQNASIRSQLFYPTTTPMQYYILSVAGTNDGQGYTLTATVRNDAANSQMADRTKCNTFTLDHVGRKGAMDLAGTDQTQKCWER